MQNQAAVLAYIDVFVTLGVIALLLVPLALTLRSMKPGGAPAGAR